MDRNFAELRKWAQESGHQHITLRVNQLNVWIPNKSRVRFTPLNDVTWQIQFGVDIYVQISHKDLKDQNFMMT